MKLRTRSPLSLTLSTLLLACHGAPAQPEDTSGATGSASTQPGPEAAAITDPGAVVVTPDNFRRAESDMYFAQLVRESGLGSMRHERELVPIDEQTVVRTNRDTYYSSAVVDLQAGPVTLTLPDPGGRFMSLLAIDEDHYVVEITHGAGERRFTPERVPTRYLALIIRTFVDPRDPADVERAHALQDRIVLTQPGGPGVFEVPRWDPVSQGKVRQALVALGETFSDYSRSFGARTEVDPTRHLVATARGWGGNPEREAMYRGVTPEQNDGQTVYTLHVPPVPVDGFWSVSVYNERGFFEQNELDAYSLNNVTAKQNADGSIDIQFGGCDGTVPNCLPITPGWNYTVRMYQPRKELLDGTWVFPDAHPRAR
jgi:hypothetical protein